MYSVYFVAGDTIGLSAEFENFTSRRLYPCASLYQRQYYYANDRQKMRTVRLVKFDGKLFFLGSQFTGQTNAIIGSLGWWTLMRSKEISWNIVIPIGGVTMILAIGTGPASRAFLHDQRSYAVCSQLPRDLFVRTCEGSSYLSLIQLRIMRTEPWTAVMIIGCLQLRSLLQAHVCHQSVTVHGRMNSYRFPMWHHQYSTAVYLDLSTLSRWVIQQLTYSPIESRIQ